MNRRAFFRRTVGALATAAIAPRLLASEPRYFPVWVGEDCVLSENLVGIAMASARQGELVTIRLVDARYVFDYRALRLDRDVSVADYVTV